MLCLRIPLAPPTHLSDVLADTMQEVKTKPPSMNAPPPPPSPQRTSDGLGPPEKSVTLQHHRAARQAVERATAGPEPPQISLTSSRWNSSGESHHTGLSDLKNWFDRSNRHPTAIYDTNSQDAEPPFFQKASDSSNEDRNPVFPRVMGGRPPLIRPTITRSSSADDFRSVIDDLTVENKRLKAKLKRYRQSRPGMMRKEKLFEIRVHGLPRRKKRELEATLRDFTASLGGASETAPQRRKPGRRVKNLYSSGENRFRHASSSSSHSRPMDSAYASQSTRPSSNAPNCSGTSLCRRSLGAQAKPSSSVQKVENHHIQDTPDGFFPTHVTLTAKERKRLVVRRLEQLFTGKISGRKMQLNQSMPSMLVPPAPEYPLLAPSENAEAAREALIHEPLEGKAGSWDKLSASNSNGDQTESGGIDKDGSGSGGPGSNGQNTPPLLAPPPEQRPTRPGDLDPNRVQIPSENMEYIRHLGLGPAEEQLADRNVSHQAGVAPDPDGWVYLNLLCNLAQLHMLNVTPSFIRSAVNEMSAKFQLSPDGRNIRWRGGTDGTRFGSDSSSSSPKGPSSECSDGSGEDGSHKKRKTAGKSGVETLAMPRRESKFGPNASNASSRKFHYKPLFIHRSSSTESSLEETGSQMSYGAAGESPLGNTGNSKWNYGGPGCSRRKRRHHGAIIYYSGAPFCTDLSGDPGDTSPTTSMASHKQKLESLGNGRCRGLSRTLSGSSLPNRPLSDERSAVAEALDMDLSSLPDLADSDEDAVNDDELEFPWSSRPEKVQLKPLEPPLEPCGLAGVMPDDHFAVVVTTRRTILTDDQVERAARTHLRRSADIRDAVDGRRLRPTSTSSPLPPRNNSSAAGGYPVEIEYLTDQIRRFKPVPLPPPSMFFPPLTESESGSASDVDEMDEDEDEESIPDRLSISQRANRQHPDHQYPESEDLSSSEEEDEIDRDERPRQ